MNMNDLKTELENLHAKYNREIENYEINGDEDFECWVQNLWGLIR